MSCVVAILLSALLQICTYVSSEQISLHGNNDPVRIFRFANQSPLGETLMMDNNEGQHVHFLAALSFCMVEECPFLSWDVLDRFFAWGVSLVLILSMLFS